MTANSDSTVRIALYNLLSDYMPDVVDFGRSVWAGVWRGCVVRAEFDYVAPSYLIRVAGGSQVQSDNVYDAVMALSDHSATIARLALADSMAAGEEDARAISADLESVLSDSDGPTVATIRMGEWFVLFENGSFCLGRLTQTGGYVAEGCSGLTARAVATSIVRRGLTVAFLEGYDAWLTRMNDNHCHIRAIKTVIRETTLQLREVNADEQEALREKLVHLCNALDGLRNYYATLDVPVHTITRPSR